MIYCTSICGIHVFHCIVYFFSMLMLALIKHENVAFHKANKIALTRSKWFYTFIIDLKPYKNLLNTVVKKI